MTNIVARRWAPMLVIGAVVVALLTAWLVFRPEPGSRAILTVKVGRNPAVLAEGPNGEVWVGHSVGCCSSGSLTAIDSQTGDILKTLQTDEPIRSGAAIGGEVWGVTGAERTIIRAAEDDLLTNIRFPGEHGDPTKIEAGEGVLWVGMTPLGTSVSDNPSAQRAVDREARKADGVIVMYDPDPAGLIRHVEVPNAPLQDFVVSGPILWVASYHDRSIHRLATHTGHIGGRVTWSLELPAPPLAIALEANHLWASLTNGTIAAIDIQQEKIVGITDVNEQVTRMAVGGGLLWALQPSEHALVAVDVASLEVVDVVTVGRNPVEVEWVGDHAWVTNTGDDTVTRISPAAVR